MKNFDSKTPSRKVAEWLEKMGNSSEDPWPQIIEFFDQNVTMEKIVPIDPIMEHDLENEKVSYKGKKDEQGRFDEFGTINFVDSGDSVTCEFVNGTKHGEAVIISPRNNISRLVGNYEEDLLQGKGA